MSDTPRTDAALQKAWDFDTEWIAPNLARKLERELAEAKERTMDDVVRRELHSQISSLRTQLESANRDAAAMRDALEAARSLVIRHHETSFVCENGMFCPVCSPNGSDAPFDEAFAALSSFAGKDYVRRDVVERFLKLHDELFGRYELTKKEERDLDEATKALRAELEKP